MDRGYAMPSKEFLEALDLYQRRFARLYRKAMVVTEAELQSSNNQLQTPQKAKTEKANG